MLQTIQMKLLCVWAEQVVSVSAKTALKFKYEIQIVKHICNSLYEQGINLKSERIEITHDLNHDLTFYCTQSIMCATV